MAMEERSKPSKTRRPTKASRAPRPSSRTLACATRAMKKITPSSQTLQKFLSSATLMHPEMYDSSKLVEMGLKVPVQPLLETMPYSSSPTISEPPSRDVETDYDAKSHFRSTISSQRHLTFPQSSNTESSPPELQSTLNPWSTEIIDCYDYGLLVNDSTRTAIHTLLRTFPDKPVYIHGSQMVHRHDIAPMIELHMLAWREDRFVRRLQRNQIAKAEIQTMRSMLGDRTTSALDNVLVARISKSDKPADIAGWLCCSIIHQRNNKSLGAANGTRVLEWNIASAVNLNKGYNSGSRTYLFGDPESLRERNDLIEVVCKGTRWSQKTEFQDEDFIAITNLVVHPNYRGAHDVRKQLILDACEKATQLGLPVYVCVPEEYYSSLYKDECGFTELGEHASLSFEPEYRRKYLVYRPRPQSPELLDTQRKVARPNRFDFGWGTSTGSNK